MVRHLVLAELGAVLGHEGPQAVAACEVGLQAQESAPLGTREAAAFEGQ